MSKAFKLIIAGGRDFADYELMESVITKIREQLAREAFTDIIIVSGEARGADLMGETYATNYKLKIDRYPAYWKRDGRGAGFARNRRMGEAADGLIAFWDGKSKGTKNMIDVMNSNDKRVAIIRYV